MTPEQTFGQLQGIGKSWRVFEARLGPEFSVVVPKVQETPGLWPEKSARAAIPVVCCDNLEPMRWRHLGVFNKELVIVSALPRGRRGDGSYTDCPRWEGSASSSPKSSRPLL
jgi:hypothetical protein